MGLFRDSLNLSWVSLYYFQFSIHDIYQFYKSGAIILEFNSKYLRRSMHPNCRLTRIINKSWFTQTCYGAATWRVIWYREFIIIIRTRAQEPYFSIVYYLFIIFIYYLLVGFHIQRSEMF